MLREKSAEIDRKLLNIKIEANFLRIKNYKGFLE